MNSTNPPTNKTFYPPFADLAGSIFITLPDNLSIEELTAMTVNNSDIILNQPNKVKVIFDNYDKLLIQNIFSKLSNNLKFTDYNSTFFVLERCNLANTLMHSPDLSWDQYLGDFSIDLYRPEDKEVLINILDNSFAVSFVKDQNGNSIVNNHETKQNYILGNFDRHITNPNLETFIIRSRNHEIVGTFGLTIVGGEVQLSAVAGRFLDFKNYKGYTGGKKLPLISAAFVEVFNNHAFFSKYEKLTFSNSKATVVKFYSDLGFDINQARKGFIFE